MATIGYQKQRFPNLQGQIFDCIICQCVVKDPKQCNGCGNLFCAACINDWTKKNNSCPNRCGNNIHSMSSGALKKIYYGLQISCVKCKKVVTLNDLQKHEQNCGRPKCWNDQICNNYEAAEYKLSKPCCSQKCQMLLKLLETGNNTKLMYKLLNDFKPKNIPMVRSISTNSNSGSSTTDLKWDSGKCGTGIVFQNNKSLVFLKEQSYVFRSVVTSSGFTSGVHYWEIIADSRTQNQLKIGVASSNNFDFNTAFCDHPFGWAFYGLGQLRHHSNASGPQYGKRLKKQGTLGVYLNMDKGVLAFSLNGQTMGVAYTDGGLTKGPIYPAVSLLHCAACTIKGELPIPGIFQNL